MPKLSFIYRLFKLLEVFVVKFFLFSFSIFILVFDVHLIEAHSQILVVLLAGVLLFHSSSSHLIIVYLLELHVNSAIFSVEFKVILFEIFEVLANAVGDFRRLHLAESDQ